MSKQISVRIDERIIDEINLIGDSYVQEGLKVSFNSVLEQCLSEGVKVVKERRGMTLKCPNCGKPAIYKKDNLTEELGGYAFDCECGNKFAAPKDNPQIKKP